MRTSTVSALFSQGFSSHRCPVTQTVAPNMTRNFEGFYISYNQHSSSYGCDTTALVLQDRVFFILNGYHADAMVEAAIEGGVQGCIDLFIERIQQVNRLSEHRMVAGIEADPFGLHQTALELLGQHGVDRIVQAVSGAQTL